MHKPNAEQFNALLESRSSYKGIRLRKAQHIIHLTERVYDVSQQREL